MASSRSLYRNRAVMLDPARLLEKRSYYLGLLPWLKTWGYNRLHLHLTDDQGCALVFPSHPELASPGAFTPEEMKAFIRAARAHGLSVIPELESLGHTRFITCHRKYRHLGGRPGRKNGFNSLHPRNSEVRALLRDLLRDIADIFPSDIIHAGLDEVDMSALPEFKGLPREEQWKPFASHAQWDHEAIRELDRRPAMWGDHILSSPKLAAAFQRDVLIFDWHYDAPLGPDSLHVFLDHGYEVWGCPASMQWNERILPTLHNQFQNLREFSANGIPLRRKGVTGMVNTVWCPWRYLSGVMDLPMAFGGHLFRDAKESHTFAVDFAADFYGLKQAAARSAGEAIWRLHATAPGRIRYDRLITCGAALTREERRWFGVMRNEAKTVARILKPLVKEATRHTSRLHDYVLTARILQVVGAYGEAGADAAPVGNLAPLLKACDRSWWSTRDATWEARNYPCWNTEFLLPTLKSLPMFRSRP